MKVKSLVAPTKVETMAFNEIETVLENYRQFSKKFFVLPVFFNGHFISLVSRLAQSGPSMF